MNLSVTEFDAGAISADFRLDYGLFALFFAFLRSVFLFFRFSGRTLALKRKQSPLGNQQIGQRQQREELRFVLGQTPIAHLPQAKPVLDDVERMFDPGTNARLHPLDPLIPSPRLGVGQGLALARSHRHMPDGIAAALFALVDALIARIRKNQMLLTMQQGMPLGDIVDVRRRGDHGVDQTRTSVHTNVHLHAEVPLIALLRLPHLRVALAILVLGRGGRRNEGRVHQGALLQHQPLGRQVCVDAGEDALGESMLLQQAAEFEQGGGVRRRLPRQVDAHEAADGLAVVHGIFRSLVREAKALLDDVHAQHPLQTDRRTAPTFTLGIERFQLRQQLSPWRHRFDVGKKTVTPRHLLLRRIFQLGKTRLHRFRPRQVAVRPFSHHIQPAKPSSCD